MSTPTELTKPTELPELTERQKLAQQSARDTVKHLLTLTTASAGVLIAIFRDLIGVDTDNQAPALLWVAFGAFALSLLFGLGALQALTGNLERRPEPSIYQGNVTLTVGLQVVFFVLAVLLSGLSVAL